MMTIQERQVRKRLRDDFGPLVDMTDVQGKHAAAGLEQMRTTRALAALCVAAQANLAAQDAAECVVDESGDRGIDAVALSPLDETIYVVQAKTGGGSPSLTEVQKFISGIRLILNSDWHELGPKLRAMSATIDKALDTYRDTHVVAIYTHLGTQPPRNEVSNESDRFVEEVNAAGDILEFRYMNLRENFENRNVAQGESSLDSDIEFENWSTISRFSSEILGVVAASEIAALVAKFGDRLYDRNIRKVLTSSSVNDSLDQTIDKQPDSFWYFNNGITIVASNISVNKIAPKQGSEKFKLTGMNVVNGAQTCGAVHRASKRGSDLGQVFITVRVVSTEGRSENFEHNVTRYTNTQNQVGGREFVALDPWQQEIQDTLKAEGVQYLFKTGDKKDPVNFAFLFDLEDATRALACFTSVTLATRAKHEIGRMWADIRSEPYISLFNRKIDPATVSNCVAFYLAVSSVIDTQADSMDSKRSKTLNHSEYMVIALLFRAVRKEVRLSDIDADISGWVLERTGAIIQFLYDVLEKYEAAHPHGYPQAFFKNQQKVSDLADTLRNDLVKTGNSLPAIYNGPSIETIQVSLLDPVRGEA